MFNRIQDPDPILPDLDTHLPDGTIGTKTHDQTFQWTGLQGDHEITLPIPTDLLGFYDDFPWIVPPEHHLVTYPTEPFTQGLFGRYAEILQDEMADSLSRGELAAELIHLVQSLPYKSLQPATQFPLTTLARGAGDCSDRTVLLGAFLYFLEQRFLSVYFPQEPGKVAHAALAIANLPGDPSSGLTIPFQGDEYLYLETTNRLRLGETGDLNRDEAVCLPPKRRPVLFGTWNARYAGGSLQVRVRAANAGSTTAHDVVISGCLADDSGGSGDRASHREGDLAVFEETIVDLQIDATGQIGGRRLEVEVAASNGDSHRSANRL